MKFFIFSIDRSTILIDQDSRAKALRLMEGRGCFIVTVSVISKRRISSRNAYIRGEEKCRRSGWHRGCSFGAATARNIKSLPATTLNREIIQSVSRGFGHSRQGEGEGGRSQPLISLRYLFSFLFHRHAAWQFLFQPICKWTFHKILSRDRDKGGERNEETSRFLNLYARRCLTSSTLLVSWILIMLQLEAQSKILPLGFEFNLHS